MLELQNNYANEYGTVWIHIRDVNRPLSVEISDCVFVGNTAKLAGGGIHFQGGLTPTTVTMGARHCCAECVAKSGGPTRYKTVLRAV